MSIYYICYILYKTVVFRLYLYTMNTVVKKLVQPTPLELLWYFTASIILLVLTHFQKIVAIFTQDEQASSSISSIIQSEVNQFLDLLSSYDFSANTVTFGFWILVGSIIYIIAMTLIDFFSEGSYFFHEETDFVHTQAYHKGTAYRDFIIKSTLHVAFFIVFALYILLFVQLLWPTWAHLFESFMDDALNPLSWLQVTLAIAGFMVSLHIIGILSRLVFLRSRVFRTIH